MPEPARPFALLYDGDCQLCVLGARKLFRLTRPGAVELVNFQEPGALDRFPGLTHETCMKAMVLVGPNGESYRGFEAAVQALATRPIIGWLARAYYLPGIRPLLDWLYAKIAANRYRILGRTAAAHCPGGTCSLHFPPR